MQVTKSKMVPNPCEVPTGNKSPPSPSGRIYETIVGARMTLSVASVTLAAATWVKLSKQLGDSNTVIAWRFARKTIQPQAGAGVAFIDTANDRRQVCLHSA